MKNESEFKGKNGFLMLAVWIVLMAGAVLGMIYYEQLLYVYIPVLMIGIFGMVGLAVVNPNESLVLVLFGKYVGSIKDNGFFWFNPLIVRKKLSLRARNFDGAPIKVNDYPSQQNHNSTSHSCSSASRLNSTRCHGVGYGNQSVCPSLPCERASASSEAGRAVHVRVYIWETRGKCNRLHSSGLHGSRENTTDHYTHLHAST